MMMKLQNKQLGIMPYVWMSIVWLSVVMAIIAYGTYRCTHDDFHDPLTRVFASPPFDQFADGWAFLHFLSFAVMAYFFPAAPHLLFMWALGVVWEIVESLFHERPFYISKCSYKLTTDAKAGWWYGRWQDILMNSLGLFVGWWLSRHV